MDAFEFPGTKHKPKDALTVTNDEITDLTPKKARRVRAKGSGSASALYDKVKTERGGKGLPTDPSDTIDDFKEMAQMKGLSENSINRVQQKEMPSIKPLAPSGGGGGGKAKSAAFGSPFGGGFFTRRVPGWEWDDHLAAYKTSSAAPFSCKCGSQFDVPAYYNCRCGAVWNAYPIGSGGDDEGRTASIDMFLCREVQVRPDMVMMASAEDRKMGDDPYYNTEGLMPAHEIDWVEDEDLEDADAPHAPAHTAAIGEDDHHVVYRDGERFCSACDAMLWDPNIHHCPEKQAARVMFGKDDDDGGDDSGDDEATKPPKHKGDEPSTLTPHLKQRVKDKKGSDGDRVEEHISGEDHKGTGRDKESAAMRYLLGDWTKYDEDDPGHGPGRAEPPSTHVSRPPDDWANRGRPTGKGSLWREPIFPSSKG